MNDRFGIGWRPELAAGILSNLDCIDIVEVIADDYFTAPRSQRRALNALAAQSRSRCTASPSDWRRPLQSNRNGCSERLGSSRKSGPNFGRNI